jgi:hypothetical protein
MGTRSNIGVREADGTTTLIYCHWDGYPSNNGRLLLNHHNSEAAARAVVALGDISSLGERTAPADGEAHSYGTPAKGVTTYYMRDRGEEGCGPRTLAAGKTPLQQEYAYIWDVPRAAWLWCGHGQPTLVPLTPEAWAKDE